MQAEQKDMMPEDAALALRWLADMGAEELIGEQPVNRFAVAPQVTPVPANPLVQPAAPVVTPGAARMLFPPAGTTSAAACKTLDDIVTALAAFDACPLKKTATRLCFADGNRQARVMLVGEAPGRDEDIQGKPFVGKSGQLLDRMLSAIGLSRNAENRDNAVFITNIIFWRPPGNRTPTETESLMCLPFVLRAIEIVAPDFIVCLGATPTQRLTGKADGILKLRGRWMTANVGGRNIPLLPTLHPAYLLRQPNQKRLAWRDLLTLRQMIDGIKRS